MTYPTTLRFRAFAEEDHFDCGPNWHKPVGEVRTTYEEALADALKYADEETPFIQNVDTHDWRGDFYGPSSELSLVSVYVVVLGIPGLETLQKVRERIYRETNER